jgi:hypothetical protein
VPKDRQHGAITEVHGHKSAVHATALALGQGFLFARPLDAEAAREFFSSWDQASVAKR